MPDMGSVSGGTIRDNGAQIPAYYQASDFVIRRDWYGLAAASRSRELTQGELKRLAQLLQAVRLDDLVVLDVQLQLAGLGTPLALNESPSIDRRNTESVIMVASGMEMALRRRYLRKMAQRLPTLVDEYRASIEARIRRVTSYRYGADGTKLTAEVHRLAASLRDDVVSLSGPRMRALAKIVRYEPRMLVHLLSDEHISLEEARRALGGEEANTLDTLRVWALSPKLFTQRQAEVIAGRLSLGEIAQLTHELPELAATLPTKERLKELLGEQLLDDASDPLEAVRHISQYSGLFGAELEFAALRHAVLRRVVDSLGDAEIDEIRQFVVLARTQRVEILQSVPHINALPLVDALTVMAILGERYHWCQPFAVSMVSRYTDDYLTSAEQLVLLDDRLANIIKAEGLASRAHSELYRLSMQHQVTAQDVALYVPRIQQFISMLRSSLHVETAVDVRQDVVSLAYMLPAAHDHKLRNGVLSTMDEAVFARLLNEAIAGSSLAVGFFGSLTVDEVLRLMLRWGSAARNGYLLQLLQTIDERLYTRLAKEVKSRALPAMPLHDVMNVLDVLAEKKSHSGAAPEKSIVFINTLIHAYGKSIAGRLVGRLGINRTDDLETMSPFYMRLLVDAFGDEADKDFAEYLLALGADRTTMSYEQALAVRAAYQQKSASFATAVVQSLQRVITTTDSASMAEPRTVPS